MICIRKYEITSGKDGLLKITDSIVKTIEESGIRNGIVVVETPHSTAGIFKITIQGNEVLDDIVKEMRRMIPSRINYYHQDSPENAAGHIKSSLFASSVSLILQEGKLLCDGKQDVYFADYDGPQIRTYSVCVIGED